MCVGGGGVFLLWGKSVPNYMFTCDVTRGTVIVNLPLISYLELYKVFLSLGNIYFRNAATVANGFRKA